MNILITGANGFVGRNMKVRLNAMKDSEFDILEFDIDNSMDELKEMAGKADIVCHFAGVNRPRENEEFRTGNYELTSQLTQFLMDAGNHVPVIMTSSIQAQLGNPYGVSKKQAEDALIEYSEKTGASVYLFRLPNLFGKWSRPNYNSVVSTFCYNIANGKEIQISDRSNEVEFAYIDDVIDKFMAVINDEVKPSGHYCEVDTTYTKTLGELADLIYSFRKSREDRSVPDMSDGFTKALYSTYLSYLPEDAFGYPLKMNIDDRGSFTEIIRTPERGQVSVNISKPGITKGNHWHDTKTEKFLVVNGRGVIRFRKIGDDNVIEYRVNGEEMRVIDIPPGYTHNIENTGDTDMVTVMWANECFDPQHPDTFYEEV